MADDVSHQHGNSPIIKPMVFTSRRVFRCTRICEPLLRTRAHARSHLPEPTILGDMASCRVNWRWERLLKVALHIGQ